MIFSIFSSFPKKWTAKILAKISRGDVNLFFQKYFCINGDCPWEVNFTSRVMSCENIHILGNPDGVHKSFAKSGGCYIQALNGIEFDEGVLFAPGVKIISANHDLRDLSKSIKANPIKIGKYCWIGANAVILPETELGEYTVVGAGAIVTKSFPPYCIIAGNPAKVIGYRCEKCKSKMIKIVNEKSFACENCNIKIDMD